MRLARIAPGRPADPSLAGAVVVRDAAGPGIRLGKGCVLGAGELAAIAAAPAAGDEVHVVVPGPRDLHEDDAARRLAAAVAGDGLEARAPVRSRVDLVAAAAGLVEIRLAALRRIDRLDAIGVFTVLDGQAVGAGELVASAKVAPHVVPAALVEAAESIARAAGPVIRVRPFRLPRLAAIGTGRLAPSARARFAEAVARKAAGLGGEPPAVTWVADEPGAIAGALAAAIRGSGGARIVLAAGGAGSDPGDPVLAAVERLGGRVVRRGAPAHPGSMLWLARVGRAAVVGLPSCGAFSMATAADLLLALLAAGHPPTAATLARLGHGGILARSQRFRFPPYARELEAPEG